jgi:hypothetical protein
LTGAETNRFFAGAGVEDHVADPVEDQSQFVAVGMAFLVLTGADERERLSLPGRVVAIDGQDPAGGELGSVRVRSEGHVVGGEPQAETGECAPSDGIPTTGTLARRSRN